jgi:hypothetical protein
MVVVAIVGVAIRHFLVTAMVNVAVVPLVHLTTFVAPINVAIIAAHVAPTHFVLKTALNVCVLQTAKIMNVGQMDAVAHVAVVPQHFHVALTKFVNAFQVAMAKFAVQTDAAARAAHAKIILFAQVILLNVSAFLSVMEKNAAMMAVVVVAVLVGPRARAI